MFLALSLVVGIIVFIIAFVRTVGASIDAVMYIVELGNGWEASGIELLNSLRERRGVSSVFRELIEITQELFRRALVRMYLTRVIPILLSPFRTLYGRLKERLDPALPDVNR